MARACAVGCLLAALAVALMSSSVSFVVAGPVWTQLTSIAKPRMEVLGGRIGDKAWVMGGYDATSPRTVTASIEEYSYSTNTWSTLSTALPVSLHHSSMAVDPDNAGHLYIACGFTRDMTTYTTTFLRWDGTSLLSTLAQVPVPQGAATMQIYAGKAYVLGGAEHYNENPTYGHVLIYDIAANTWSRGANNMTVPREHLASGRVDGVIYTIGGRYGQNPSQVRATNNNEAYDIATGTWSTKASMPTPRSGCHAAVVGGLIYVFGGDDRTYDNVEAYNPTSDSWTCFQPMPYPRHGMGVWSLGPLIYLVSGGWAAATTLSATFMQFNTTGALATSRACTAANPWTNWVSSESLAVAGTSYFVMKSATDVVYDFGASIIASTGSSVSTSTGGSQRASTGSNSGARGTGGVAAAAAATLVSAALALAF